MIKFVREFYGIPQSLLAGYLRVSRSHLSMMEIHRRELPGKSSLKILKLFKAMSDSETVKDGELKEKIKAQKIKRSNEISRLLDTFRFQHKAALNSLTKMKEDQSRSIKVISSLAALQKNAESRLDEGLIGLIEINARKLQQSTGSDSKMKLELQIVRLEAEMRFLESL